MCVGGVGRACPRARSRGIGVRKAGKTLKPIAEEGAFNDAAEAAIARVLGAEREARESVQRARLEVSQIAENARLDARSVAERAERRIRAVVGAFERELAARLAELDAGAARLAQPQPLTPEELADLQREVRLLARELIGVPP